MLKLLNMRLLLISSSRPPGYEYLGHCQQEIQDFLGSARKIVSIPYAKPDPRYREISRKTWAGIGVEIREISSTDPLSDILQAAGIFVAGGNTFRLLNRLYKEKLLDPIRKRVLEGMPYMGASAGSNIAGPTIQTTNDMPIVVPPSMEALNLIPFQINPHYYEPGPDGPQRGETRSERIQEFLEENNSPVIALRECAYLRIENNKIFLGGDGAKVFRRGLEPEECLPNSQLDGKL